MTSSVTSYILIRRPHVAEWVNDLRSGGYLQGQGRLLNTRIKNGVEERRYCCLGVAEETHAHGHCDWQVQPRLNMMLAPPGSDNAGHLSLGTMRWLGLDTQDPYVVLPLGYGLSAGVDVVKLTKLNDGYAASLATIGDVIAIQSPNWDGTYDGAVADARDRFGYRGVA